MESKIPTGSHKVEGKIPPELKIGETPSLGKREVETKPGERRTDDVSHKIDETSTLSEREMESATVVQRRTEAVEHKIDELKDNRGFAHKIFGFLIADLDAKALSENFGEVKKSFEQYKEFGIEIPKDILRNFELSDGTPVVGGPAYLTEEQAEELKKLASEGEKMLQKKLLQEKLDQREITYGPFVTKDIVPKVVEQGLTPADIKHFLSISTSFRQLAKPRIILTATELLDPKNEKLQFARENNLKLSIKLETTDEIKRMIAFLENPDNRNLLNNLEVLDLPDIDDLNIAEINLLLNKCPNLTSFSCGSIRAPLTLTQLNNLNSFSCVEIMAPLTLSQCDNLTSFSCGSIGATLTLTELDKLTTFSCADIFRPLTLTQLNNLSSFSCWEISAPLTLTQLNNLNSFSCKTIGASLTLTELDNLISFSCGSIYWGVILTFSEEFPRLQYIHFGHVDNPSAREILGNLQAQIQARQSQQLPPQ